MAEGSMGKEEINDVIMHDSENHASLPSFYRRWGKFPHAEAANSTCH
jgi:hypothetical protein